jgi:coronin-1B/1C/6
MEGSIMECWLCVGRNSLLTVVCSCFVQECFQDFRLSTVTGDQQYIKASAKHFAVGMAGGGGPVVVMPLNRPGRFDDSSSPFIHGHSGAVLDIEWSPFDDNMMATASEDTKIKIWQIPDNWEPIDEQGNAKAGESLSDAMCDLTAHTKKVTLLRYHPTAANTLLSTAADYTVKVWDVESQQDLTTFGDIPNQIHDIIWDFKGELYACSCKDKVVRIVDPRTGLVASEIAPAHEGVKSVKMFYAKEYGKLITCGASKTSAREIKVWDLKDLSKPLHVESVDTAAGAMIPLFDSDTDVLYLCGKGDGIIRVYEYEEKAPFIYKLNDGFRSNIPGKGYCLVPKRGLEVMQHETARIMKCTNNEGVHPLRFHVPRKSDAFQDDIFPPAESGMPSHSCQEWFEGSAKAPLTMSLNPKDNGVESAAVSPVKAVFKSVGSLSKELAEAQKRIAYLESKLSENSISY